MPPDRSLGVAVVTGAVAGTLIASSRSVHSPFHGASIKPVTDANGNYTCQIEIVTPAGVVYRLGVFEEYTIHEDAYAA